MDIKPIKSEEDYRATLREIELLMSAAPDSQEGELLDVLVTLVEAYERQHFPLDLPDAVAAISGFQGGNGMFPAPEVRNVRPKKTRDRRIFTAACQFRRRSGESAFPCARMSFGAEEATVRPSI